MIKKTVTLEETVAFLNALVKIDRDAMQRLVGARVECNLALADHPTVQAGPLHSGPGSGHLNQTEKKEERFELGFVGVLNGLFGIDDEGWGSIAANYVPDEKGKIEGFMILKANTKGKERESWPNYPEPFPQEGK